MLKSVACSVTSLALAAAMAASSPAFAEGLPERLPPQEFVPFAPAAIWSGIYVGFQGGFAWGNSDWRFRNVSHFNDFIGDRFNHDPSGSVFGGQIGFNKQYGHVVWGLEASLAGADIRDSSRSPFFVADRLRTNVDLIWTVTGRLGYEWGPMLTYVKGGYAGADVAITVRDPVTPVRAHEDETRNGWTVGGGVEYLLSSQVVFGVEYDFLDFGDRSHSIRASDGSFLAVDTDASAQVVTARLSYKFTRDLYVPVPFN